MDKKISVIGIGRLGIAFALLAEKAGYSVMGCDVREDYVESLNLKQIKTPEPQIEFLLHKSKNFTATTDINKAFEFSDLIFLFVPTPSLPNGEYNHQYIEEVYASLIDYSNSGKVVIGKTIVIGCTVMPQYCKSLQESLESFGMDIVYNPEFIAQGDIVNGLEKADFILMGSSSTADLSGLIDVYKSIMVIEPNFKFMSHTAAEITKIGLNCFLTMKITFANMIGEIAIESGEEDMVDTILSAIGSDARIGNKFLRYGFGYSGVCLPRDNKALGIYAQKIQVPDGYPLHTDWFNNHHFLFLKEQFMKENPDKSVPFAFNQLSYKKGVDILTESQHYRMCKELLDEGYIVIINESDIVTNIVKTELAQYADQIIYGNETQAFPEKHYLIDL